MEKLRNRADIFFTDTTDAAMHDELDASLQGFAVELSRAMEALVKSLSTLTSYVPETPADKQV